ncbi:MAG TPA: hypothetical protein VGD81_15470 [Opitutaceae bacterium]
MNTELGERVGAILGRQVSVNTEGGALTVLDLTTFQFLLHTSKLPAAISPEWVVAAIDRKARVAADVKARRVAAAEQLRSFLTSRGIAADGVSIYFTATGFSVENLFRDGLEHAKRLLADSQIPFKRLEYSPAHWVVRVIL